MKIRALAKQALHQALNAILGDPSCKMNQIYKPPESKLIGENELPVKPHIFWRIFFWFHVVVTPLLAPIILDERLSLFDLIDFGVFIIIIVGLFGYSYSKKILSRGIWMGIAIIYPFWFLFYEFVLPFVFNLPLYGEFVEFDAWLLLSLLFGIPSGLAFFFYGYKSDYIWGK